MRCGPARAVDIRVGTDRAAGRARRERRPGISVRRSRRTDPCESLSSAPNGEEHVGHERGRRPAGAGPACPRPARLSTTSGVTVRFERLLEIVGSLGSCVVALSGGIDSSVLLAVAASLLRRSLPRGNG